MPSVSFLPFLQTVPWGTRLLTGVVVVASLLYHAAAHYVTRDPTSPRDTNDILPWLVMIPSTSWRYPWTLLTAGIVETTWVELIVTLATVPLACRYLERLWGLSELLRFTCLVIVGSNIIAFGFSWIVYIVTRSDAAINGVPYHGLSGLLSGILVAFTQIIPEHQIQLFGVIKARVKTTPGIFLLISNVLVIVLGPSPFILIQFGFFVAWVYLRFYKLSENGEYRGDRSETFAFQYWLPPPIRPYASVALNYVFTMAVRLRLVQPWDDAQTNAYASLPGPGGARAEAERRRAVALRALDARLASTSPGPQTPVDTSKIATPPPGSVLEQQPPS